jgi:SNF2 family DNA or RNA helicase
MSLEEFNQNFIRLCETEILLHDTLDDNDIFMYLLDNSTVYIFSLKDVYENNRLKHRFIYDTNIKKTIHTTECLRYSKYYCDSIVFPFLNWNHQYRSNNTFQEHSFSFASNDFFRANFITKLEKIDDKYYIVNYGNKKLLQKIISTSQNKRQDYKAQLFMDVVYHSIKLDIIKECERKMLDILNNLPNNTDLDTIEVGVEKLLKDDIKLYNYQKNDIRWMNKLKENIDNHENILSIEQSVFYNKKLDGNDYLLYNGTILPNLNNQITTKNINLKYYGGNIVSEVGLGKTLVVLGHIFNNHQNNYDNFIEYDNIKCNYFFKRGKNKTTNCIKDKKDELYCKEHSKTLFIDKRNTHFKNLDNFNLRDYIVNVVDKNGDNRQLFKTNASLIICPNQLCDQWVREYYDKFKQDSQFAKRVLLIVTYDQYKNLSFGDILFADLIVVSYNFLLNTNYFNKTGFNSNSVWKRYKNYKKGISQILDELDSDENINTIGDLLNIHHEELNVLDNYYFKGVYLDENHEIITKPKTDTLQRMIKTFQSDYKWNISATPFANGVNSFIYNTNYTTNSTFDCNDIYNLNSKIIHELSVLYRRNTRESVQDEFAGNIISDKIKLLEFTGQERSIYDAHMAGNSKNNRDFLIKLCCDTSIDVETRNLVKNCKTLDEIQKVILDHNKKKLVQLSKSMQSHKNKIEELLVIVNRGHVLDERDNEGDIFENIERVKLEIGIFRRKLTNDKKEFDTVNRTYTFLKNAVDNIKELDTCPICLDDIPTDQIAITKCGHKFCKDCIHEFIEELNIRYDDIKCPKCNIVINKDDIYLLKDIEIQEILHDSCNELDTLVQKIKSTKIGNIIYYLKHEMKDNDKCIIFSQWDNMLTKIGNILKQEKVDVLYCSGTVYQRKRAINKFQTDSKSNIICLSSENCASGINLTSANKIILIEPIYGTKEYRKDIENQAIGRADRIGQKRPIEIIRFIIKNTIEEDILHDNNQLDNDNENNINENNVLVV